MAKPQMACVGVVETRFPYLRFPRVALAEKMEVGARKGDTVAGAQALLDLAAEARERAQEQEVVSGGDGGADASESRPEDWFNLEVRSDRMIGNAAFSVAKTQAAKIRYGSLKYIQWWTCWRGKPEPVRHLRLHKGVHEFVCNQSVCQQLANFLEDQKNYTEEGFLNIAGTTWPGYGGYPYVHAHLGHMPCQQQARTVRVAKKADVDFILSNEPLVQALLWQVRDRLHLPQPSGRDVQPPGKCVRAMHFLLQDATQQAVFSWHDDADDIKCRGMLEECLRAMTTVIVNLSDECSGMRIWGHDLVLYRRVGDAVAFPGAALHETVPRRATCPAKRVVRKVAFFFL